MTQQEPKQTRKKILEVIGCLGYLVAVVILVAVFIAHCDGIFK
jgi:hypothetical protein